MSENGDTIAGASAVGVCVFTLLSLLLAIAADVTTGRVVGFWCAGASALAAAGAVWAATVTWERWSES